MSRESDKWERQWLESKNEAIRNYGDIAAVLAEKIINNKFKLANNWLLSLINGKWDKGLEKWKNNDLMANRYRESLQTITRLPQLAKAQKIEEVYALRTYWIIYMPSIFNNWQQDGTSFAKPSYRTLFQRFFTECSIGLNWSMYNLTQWKHGQLTLPFQWDVYMRDQFGWIYNEQAPRDVRRSISTRRG